MPAYVVAADVRNVLSPDGADAAASTAASMDDAGLAPAIVEATDEVNAKLGGRHTVPFDPVPSLITTITRDIAAYLATLTFRRGDPLPSGDPVGLRYDRAEKILAGLASGAVSLPDPAGGVEADDVSAVAVVNPYSGDMFTLDDFGLADDGGRVAVGPFGPPWPGTPPRGW